ncbi:uncharacterized protein CLUP02_01825 [Colletotrichum lupini]|uniref:Uncharacterized protein n=1 Tax=Colletotrichum lupini TaxID=145971 RepID=A0A9Q8WA27_9PEZI|nr:uncharacterized protein CLUP02_01825 [Colletotrichum lupini]UQC75172.1 hypothetical protein CLUP02_01825 [Colletotrichum lupini]
MSEPSSRATNGRPGYQIQSRIGWASALPLTEAGAEVDAAANIMKAGPALEALRNLVEAFVGRCSTSSLMDLVWLRDTAARKAGRSTQLKLLIPAQAEELRSTVTG